MINRMKFVIVTVLSVACSSAGAEPWKQHTIDDSSRGADGVRLFDVNGDRLLDVATGWEEGGIVRAYLNPGPRRSKKRWPAVTVGQVNSPEDAVFFDVDDDGAVDVVSCCEGQTRSVFVHWAPAKQGFFLQSQAWRTEAIPATAGTQQWMFAMPLQVDGRGGRDLVVASKGPHAEIGWLQSPQDPRNLAAWKYHRLADASWVMSLREIDIDNDGDADIVASDRKGANSRVLWLENSGDDAPWIEHVVGAVGKQVMFLDIGDLFGDPVPQLVVPVPPRVLLILSPTDDPRESWDERTISYPDGYGTAKAARIADVNLDGQMDIVVSCENARKPLSGVFWMEWRSEKEIRWIDHDIGGPAGIKFDRIEVIDLDADGDLDVMSCEERDQLGVIWYENPTLTGK